VGIWFNGTSREGDTSGGVVEGLIPVVVSLAWLRWRKGCNSDVISISFGRTIVGELRLAIVVVGTRGGIRVQCSIMRSVVEREEELISPRNVAL
jgi:hypothetical protein